MEELSLKWDEHHPAIISVFEELLSRGTLVDCTIAAGGQYVKAHKVVLAACSPYFELLFSQENEKNPIVVLKDIKFQELKHMIDFVYRGQVKVHRDHLDDFVAAAESLQIKGLSGHQRRKILEKTASKTGSSREGRTSPIPRKRRRNNRTGPNEGNESDSSLGNESGNDSNVRENLMQTEVPSGVPSMSVESSSTGAAPQTINTQDGHGVTEKSFPSQDQPSVLPEQLLPDVETIVKTEPEEPTQPLAQVFFPEPKNEEYVDEMAMLDCGGSPAAAQDDTSRQHTNAYPGFPSYSTGNRFLMNQMTDQNTAPGAARCSVFSAPSPRRSLAIARVTAGSARTARLVAQARARLLRSEERREQMQQKQQQQQRVPPASVSATTSAAAATALTRLLTSPEAERRKVPRLPKMWSPLVVLHDIRKHPLSSVKASPRPLQEESGSDGSTTSRLEASGRREHGRSKKDEHRSKIATASSRSVAGSSSPAAHRLQREGVRAHEPSTATPSRPVYASADVPAPGRAASTPKKTAAMVTPDEQLSVYAPVTPPPDVSPLPSPSERTPRDSSEPQAASSPTKSLDTSLEDNEPLVRWKGAKSRGPPPKRGRSAPSSSPSSDSAPPPRSRRRSSVEGDVREAKPTALKPKKPPRRKWRRRTKSSGDACAAREAAKNVASTSLNDVAVHVPSDDRDDPPAADRPLSRARSTSEKAAGGKKGSSKRSRKRSVVSSSGDTQDALNGSDINSPENVVSTPLTVTDAAHVTRDERDEPLTSEHSVSLAKSTPPREVSAGDMKTPPKRSRKKIKESPAVVDANINNDASDNFASMQTPIPNVSDLSRDKQDDSPASQCSISRVQATACEVSVGNEEARKGSRKSEVSSSGDVEDTLLASDTNTSENGASLAVADAPAEASVEARVDSPLSERYISRARSKSPRVTLTAEAKSPGKRARRTLKETPPSGDEDATLDVREDVASTPAAADDSTPASRDASDEPLPCERSVTPAPSTPPPETAVGGGSPEAAPPVDADMAVDAEDAPSPSYSLPTTPSPDYSVVDNCSTFDDDEVPPYATPRTDVSGRSSVMSNYSTVSLWTEICSSPPRDASGQYTYSPLDDDKPVVLTRKPRRKSGPYVDLLLYGETRMIRHKSDDYLNSLPGDTHAEDKSSELRNFPLDDDARQRQLGGKAVEQLHSSVDDNDDMSLDLRASRDNLCNPSVSRRSWRSRSATPGPVGDASPPRRRSSRQNAGRKSWRWRSAEELSSAGPKPKGRPRRSLSGDAKSRGRSKRSASSSSRPRGRPRKSESRSADVDRDAASGSRGARRSTSRGRSTERSKHSRSAAEDGEVDVAMGPREEPPSSGQLTEASDAEEWKPREPGDEPLNGPDEWDARPANSRGIAHPSPLAADFATCNMCLTCGSLFFSVTELRRHTLKKHPQRSASPRREKAAPVAVVRPWSCQECARAFDDESSLRTHQDTHRPHICSECGERFAQAGDLGVHRTVCHAAEGDDRPQYECDVCGKACGKYSSLHRHRKKAHPDG